MNIETHRQVYRAVIEAVGEDDPAALDDLLAEDLVDHNPIPGQAVGREGFRQWMQMARGAFADLSATVEDTLAEADRVAGRVTYRGTHTGILAGVGPTHQQVEFVAIHVARFEGRLITEWWGTADVLSALLQVGARILPPEA